MRLYEGYRKDIDDICIWIIGMYWVVLYVKYVFICDWPQPWVFESHFEGASISIQDFVQA